MNEKPWWYHEDGYIEKDHDGPVYNEKAVASIVAEAERRGYERAMEEAKKAIITTADALLSGGAENEERFEAVIIPKSFFE